MSVYEYGRGFFLVDSHSRNGLRHLVDFEPQLLDDGTPDPDGEPYRCSCESWNLRGDRPCRHCIECYEYLLPILEHLSHWKKEQAKPKRKPRNYTIHDTRPPKPPTPKRRLHESVPCFTL